MFTLRLIFPLAVWFLFGREGGKKPKVLSQASRSPNPTPSHLQTRQQTGPLCRPRASGPLPQPFGGEAGTPRCAVRQVCGDAAGSRAYGLRLRSAEGSVLEGSPGSPRPSPPSRPRLASPGSPVPAAGIRGPYPPSRGATPPKGVSVDIRGRSVPCAGSHAEQRTRRAQKLGGAR